MSEQEHISPEMFRRMFPGATRSAIEANLSAWMKAGQLGVLPDDCRLNVLPGKQPVKKRIRQSSKPLLNKLETEFSHRLATQFPSAKIRPQAKRYMLANGTWYRPDFTAIVDGKEHAWEVKGPHAFRGGFENLKVAASTFPEVVWHLVWKDKQTGEWKEQIVLP